MFMDGKPLIVRVHFQTLKNDMVNLIHQNRHLPNKGKNRRTLLLSPLNNS